MVFGKIEYLNLLPFHLQLKRFASKTHFQQSIHYKKGVPATINREFHARRIDAAFISSITAQKYAKGATLGIVAKKEVLSVIVIPKASHQNDSESETSNTLAQLLQIKGEVLIGDKALRHQLTHNNGIDLAQVWHERTRLPFVFALLCAHKNRNFLHHLENKLTKQQHKIPYYIIKQASLQSGLSITQINYYLSKISYSIGEKERRALAQFYRLARLKKFKMQPKH